MASQAQPPPDPAREQQHCSQCFHRRLVCDGARPACQKCLSRGLTCPGYLNARPLRWLTPGRVTSRTRGKARRIPGRSAHPVSVSKSNSGNSRDSSESNQEAGDAWLSGDQESSEDVASTAIYCRQSSLVGLFRDIPLASEASNIVQARLYRAPYPLHSALSLHPSSQRYTD